MTGAAPFRVGRWLPSDQQVLERWLDDLIAKTDARGDVPLFPVVEEFRQLIERDPEIYMLFAFMLTQTPRKPTPTGKPQVRTVDHMLKLFNHIMTHAPEYDDTGLVGTPINAILDLAMGTHAGFAAFLNDRVNRQFKRMLKRVGPVPEVRRFGRRAQRHRLGLVRPEGHGEDAAFRRGFRV